MPPPLALTLSATTGREHARFLARHLTRAHVLLRPPLRELSIVLVGDRRMSLLHALFMGISGPTDVLTFPLDLGLNGRVTSGEVVVCVPEARRQARPRGIPLERELLLYALHGMLHLCGFDDRTDRAFATMHRKEDEILTRLGLGPVFQPERLANRRNLPARRRRAPPLKASRRNGAAG